MTQLTVSHSELRIVTQLTVSHSELRTFLACPTKHRFSYLLRRESTAPRADALTKGGQIDVACAALVFGGPAPEPTWPDDPAIRALVRAWDQYWPHAEFLAEEHHVKFRFELSPGLELIGEFDAIGTYQGRRVILERKSSSEDISPGSSYWQRVELSDAQVSLYLLAADRLGLGITEILYDVLRKPALRPKKGETPEAFEQRCLETIAETPEHYFQRKILTRLEPERAAHVRDVHGTVRLMQAAAFLGEDTPRNTGSCWAFGRPCEFFPVCGLGASIDDPELFRAREGSRIRTEATMARTVAPPSPQVKTLQSECIRVAAALVRIPAEAVIRNRELIARDTTVAVALELKNASDGIADSPEGAPRDPAIFPRLDCSVCSTEIVCNTLRGPGDPHALAVRTWLGPGRLGWRHQGCSSLGIIEVGLVESEPDEIIPFRVVEDETERKALARKFSF